MTSGNGTRTGARFARAILVALGAFAVTLWAGVATAAPAAPNPTTSPQPAASSQTASISGPGIAGTETFSKTKNPTQYVQLVSMVSWMDGLAGNIITTTPPDLGPDYTIKLLTSGHVAALYDLYPLCPGGARSYRSDGGTGGTWFYAPRNLVDTLTALGVPVAAAALPSGASTPRVAVTAATLSFGDVLKQSRTALLMAGGAAAFVLIVLGLAARRSRRVERRRTAPAAVSRLTAVTARRGPASGSGGPTARLRPDAARAGAASGPRAAVPPQPGRGGATGRPTSLLHGGPGTGTPTATTYGRPRDLNGAGAAWGGAGSAARASGYADGGPFQDRADGTAYGRTGSEQGFAGAGTSGVEVPGAEAAAAGPGAPVADRPGAGLPRAQRPVPPLPTSPAAVEADGARPWFTSGTGTPPAQHTPPDPAGTGPAPDEPAEDAGADPAEPQGVDYMPVRRVYPPPGIVAHPDTAVRGSAQVPGQVAEGRTGDAGIAAEDAEGAEATPEGHRVVAMARVPAARTESDPLPPATPADEPETSLDLAPTGTRASELAASEPEAPFDAAPADLDGPGTPPADPGLPSGGPSTDLDVPPAGLDPAGSPLDAPLAALDALLAEPPGAWRAPLDTPTATLDVERVEVTPVPPPWETRAAAGTDAPDGATPGADPDPVEPAGGDGASAPLAATTEVDDAAGRTREVGGPLTIDAGFPAGGEDAGTEQVDGDGDGPEGDDAEHGSGDEIAEPDGNS